jgi:tetratricopeptide (TPR) repeat protein
MENELAKIIEQKKANDKRLRIITTIIISIAIALVFLIYDSLNKKQDVNHELLKDKAVLKKEVAGLKGHLDSVNAASEKIALGATYAMSKQPQRAIEAYSQAIKLDPKNPVAYRLRGYIYLITGKKERAVKDLQISVKIDPSEVWSHYNLALAYMAVKDTLNALSEVKKVITLDGDFRETIEKDIQFKTFRKLPGYIEIVRSNEGN